MQGWYLEPFSTMSLKNLFANLNNGIQEFTVIIFISGFFTAFMLTLHFGDQSIFIKYCRYNSIINVSVFWCLYHSKYICIKWTKADIVSKKDWTATSNIFNIHIQGKGWNKLPERPMMIIISTNLLNYRAHKASTIEQTNSLYLSSTIAVKKSTKNKAVYICAA